MLFFSDLSPQTWETETKLNKEYLIKLKSISIAKETINKMKKLPTNQEKIFANNATDKGLTSRIYKQLIKLEIKNNKHTNSPTEK